MNSFLQMIERKKSGAPANSAPFTLPARPMIDEAVAAIPDTTSIAPAQQPAALDVEVIRSGSTPVVRRARQTSFLRRRAEDFSLEERALRDEKIQFIREAYDYSRREHCPEWKACEHVAADCAGFFPRLSTAGKHGKSALTYSNYRNWLTGTSDKPGLGRLADGSPDYDNADILLRNYGCDKGLYGDPAFWESFKAHYLQSSAQKLAKIYRLLELKWRLDYPGEPIPAIWQLRTYIRNHYPKRFIAYMRKGENYYLQHFRDFNERDPDTLRPNEAWVADSQDCDFMIRVPHAGGGWDVVRPKICVLMDIKSQRVVSIQLVSGAVSNEVIRNAFALAVFRYGRPRVFLTDNGTDYCKVGFTTPVTFTPSVSKTKIYNHSIMLSLDILHLKGEKYNARTKYVERFFKELAEYSRAARGYVGNAPENRPATAKVWAKEDNREHLMNEEEACKFLGAMIALYHNRKCPDSKYLRGLSPEQAFAPELRYTRPAMSIEEYKRAFQLPLQEAHIVEPRGPAVRCNNRRYVAVPSEREKLWKYDGKPVMIKVDLISDEHVFLYDLDGTYICEAQTPAQLPYFSRTEHERARLAEAMENIRAEKKYLDTMAMDETGGWHKLDPWTLFQLPREAFLGPAQIKLLDTMYSVKGETHNPRVYVLPEELRCEDVTEARQPRKLQTVCAVDSATRSTKRNASPERQRKVGAAIRKALLKDDTETESKDITATPKRFTENADETTIENKERKLDENFI